MELPALAEPHKLDARTIAFYSGVLNVLLNTKIPFLVGGGFAFGTFTGIVRDTKDLDVFVVAADLPRVLKRLAQAGYKTENKFPHWLAKVYYDGLLVDIIFNSGNGECPVDSLWFEHAPEATLFGQLVRLTPVEEMIWQKAFIMERHRYDGADVIHLMHACRDTLNWERLVQRFGEHWLVLLSHLLLYRFTYPDDRSRIAQQTIERLVNRLPEQAQNSNGSRRSSEPLCRGTLLSLLEYLPEVNNWGYMDARRLPQGHLSPAEIEHWTNEFER